LEDIIDACEKAGLKANLLPLYTNTFRQNPYRYLHRRACEMRYLLP